MKSLEYLSHIKNYDKSGDNLFISYSGVKMGGVGGITLCFNINKESKKYNIYLVEKLSCDDTIVEVKVFDKKKELVFKTSYDYIKQGEKKKSFMYWIRDTTLKNIIENSTEYTAYIREESTIVFDRR